MGLYGLKVWRIGCEERAIWKLNRSWYLTEKQTSDMTQAGHQT